MSQKRFIFINETTKQWFHSQIDDAVEGFVKYADFRLSTGEIDYQGFDNARQDLSDDCWSEVPSPQFYHINLYYMKESGKYYSSGVLEVPRGEADANPAKNWLDTVDHIRYLLDSGNLPGLVKGSRFEVFTTGDDHPNAVPTAFRIHN